MTREQLLIPIMSIIVQSINGHYYVLDLLVVDYIGGVTRDAHTEFVVENMLPHDKIVAVEHYQ